MQLRELSMEVGVRPSNPTTDSINSLRMKMIVSWTEEKDRWPKVNSDTFLDGLH